MRDFYQKNEIHPTAIIGEQVTMGSGNRIGAYCVLEGKVTLGDGNDLGVGVVTNHQVNIGNNCKIYPYVSLGFSGEMGAKGDKLPEGKGVEIEDDVTIREFVNVHAPYWWDSTRVGAGAYIMNKSYLAHDVQIGKKVLINAGVCLGGRAVIGDFANIGMNTAVHQRTVVGENAMVGMNSTIKKDVPPYLTVVGSPARILKINKVGLERRGFSGKEIEELELNFEEILEGEIVVLEGTLANSFVDFFEKHSEVLRLFYNSKSDAGR